MLNNNVFAKQNMCGAPVETLWKVGWQLVSSEQDLSILRRFWAIMLYEIEPRAKFHQAI